MALEDLFNGLNAFTQGMKEYTTSKAIGEATDQLKEITTANMDKTAKNTAQLQLGQQLALHLQQLGAPQEQIKGTVGAINPYMPTDSKDAYMRGMLTGDKEMLGTAKKAQGFEMAPQSALSAQQYKQQSQLQKEQYQYQAQIHYMDQMAKQGGGDQIPFMTKTDPKVKLSEKEITDSRDAVKNMLTIGSAVNKLEEMVKDVGTESFSLFSNKSTEMKTQQNELIMQLKGFYDLGVLQKIDIDQLEKIVPDPTSATMTGTKWQSQMNVFKSSLMDKIQATAESKGLKIKPELWQRMGVSQSKQAMGIGKDERVDWITNAAGDRMLAVIGKDNKPVRPYEQK